MQDKLTDQIKQGFDLLKADYDYSQAQVVKKMNMLGYLTNKSSFSNVLNNKKTGTPTLQKICAGIDKIVGAELGMEFLDHIKTYQKKNLPNDWEPTIIGEAAVKKAETGFEYFEEGRWNLSQKVEFLNTAQKEVIELGVRLNTFANYFQHRRDAEFKDHIEALLARGVNVKLYMLNPNSHEALFYFKDRAKFDPKEEKSIEVMKEVTQKLKTVEQDFKASKLEGKFQLHYYKHLPYNHFLIVDGGMRKGQMLVSHYLYGVKRANCPVVKINKQLSPKLFKRYWHSFKTFTKDASLVS